MIFNNYLFNTDNCKLLTNSCLELYNIVEQSRSKWLESMPKDYMQFANGSVSTKAYDTYNIFLSPQPGFAELYRLIQSYFKEKEPAWEEFSAAGWVNVYNKSDYLDWHKHGSDLNNHDGRWHGYVCINAEPSKTLYKDDNSLVETIENKNGYITLSPGGLYHRTTPWGEENSPRITIAFDFVKRNQIERDNISRWIPVT